ncbi:MAG: methionyl-tRNA formyltransferase [Chlamydiales bacterium]
MRIVFFGTSSFAAAVLKFLLEQKIPLVAIVTRPDRPFGRAQRLAPPPVKVVAAQLCPEIPLFQPEKSSTPEFVETVKAFAPDLFVVVAYGEILKKNLLQIPTRGAINIHASLLPKYRGAAPMQRALMDGCKESGVTIQEMVLEMDAGAVLETVKLQVPDEMTCGELSHELCKLACPALVNVIHAIETGEVQKIPQDLSLVTFASKITPQEERIHWSEPAEKIHNQIRALSPIPGAWCEIEMGGEKKRLKIKRSRVILGVSGAPGTVLSSGKEELIIVCGRDGLSLLEVQLEGKKSMPARDFLRGMHAPLHLS